MAYLNKDSVILANTGDSKTIVLGKLQDEIPIIAETKDHKPEDPEEARRVANANGQINTTAQQNRQVKQLEHQ